MTREWTKRRGLIALNAGLLVVLAAVSLAPQASAQRGARARGEYTMVSGRLTGGSNNAAYVIDSSNQEMIALVWNNGRKGLEGIGYRDITADSGAAPGR
jgi:hypothetical protein